jgi:hypothetical protein
VRRLARLSTIAIVIMLAEFVGSGFVVACEAAVLHEPAQGALDHPSAFEDAESLGLWVFGDDPYRRNAPWRKGSGPGVASDATMLHPFGCT